METLALDKANIKFQGNGPVYWQFKDSFRISEYLFRLSKVFFRFSKVLSFYIRNFKINPTDIDRTKENHMAISTNGTLACIFMISVKVGFIKRGKRK